jgi:hypothetical protein
MNVSAGFCRRLRRLTLRPTRNNTAPPTTIQTATSCQLTVIIPR